MLGLLGGLGGTAGRQQPDNEWDSQPQSRRNGDRADAAEGGRPGLWRTLKATWAEQGQDNASILAAGTAFYMLFSLFPALTAVMSIYGLFTDPQTVEQQLASLGQMLPPQARELVLGQLSRIAQAPQAGLGLGAAIGVLVALWSASAAMQTLITALNIAFEVEERRSYPKFLLVSIGLTLAVVLFLPIALGLVAIVPAVLTAVGGSGWIATLANWSRWPLLALLLLLALAALYRYAPAHEHVPWRWISWGAVVATVLWIIISVSFSVYVSRFADYNATYGSLGAVVILLFWFYLTAYAILLGAELNAEIERQETGSKQAAR